MQPEPIIDEAAFIQKYWHPNTEVVTVTNPTKDDYIFQATVDAQIDIRTGRPRPESRQYMVKAGGSERFPGSIANMYLDQMSKNLAQLDKRLDRMVDFSEKAKYYDKLTVDTEDLIAAYSPHPAFQPSTDTQVGATTQEIPFAGLQAKTDESSKTTARSPKAA